MNSLFEDTAIAYYACPQCALTWHSFAHTDSCPECCDGPLVPIDYEETSSEVYA